MTAALVANDLAARPGTAPVSVEVSPGDRFDLCVPDPHVCRLLLEVLATLRRPASGTLRIEGVDAVADAAAARRRVMLVNDCTLPGDREPPAEYVSRVTAYRLQRHGRALHSLVAATCARAGVHPMRSTGTLGMDARRRVAIATALAIRPAVLIVDELDGAWPLASSLTGWETEARAGGCAVVRGVSGPSAMQSPARDTAGPPTSRPSEHMADAAALRTT